MQINTIEVAGLWSYRDHQRINIAGLPLLVGVGPNGAGKSTLLVQSIVAAFYGKFQTKTIEESINSDASRGTVAVEFDLSGTSYRVERTYQRGGTASGVVQVRDDDTWRPVTEKGTREVTAYITDLLGTDYETATMTWLAQQDDYGRFASATPADRFKLLARVFGLDLYEPKASRAHELYRRADQQVDTLDGRISEVEESMMRYVDAPETEWGSLSDDALAESVAHSGARIAELEATLAQLDLDDPARRIAATKRDLEAAGLERHHISQRAAEMLSRSEDDARRARTSAETATRQAEARLEAAVAAAAQRGESARAAADDRVRRAAQALADSDRAAHEIAEHTQGSDRAAEKAKTARTSVEALRGDIAELSTRRDTLKAQWASLKESASDVQARIDTLTHMLSDSTAECFTCGQHLSHRDAEALIDAQTAELQHIRDRQSRVQPEGKRLVAQVKQKTDRVEQLEAEATDAESEAQRFSSLMERARALTDARDANAEALVAAEEARAGAHGQEESDAAAARDAHDREVAQANTVLESALTEASHLSAEAGRLADSAAEPSEAENDLSQRLADLERDAQQSQASACAHRAETAAERDSQSSRLAALNREVARRAEVAAAREADQGRLDALRAELSAASHDRDVHQTLYKAFSPGGIPSMILAGVLDELNEAVNVSLERLSDGQLSVDLRTTRTTAKGTFENKLTVYVSTPTGDRSYETLSGGQKFRVDLAIRAGLSSVVSRGTGVDIQTLIIDEGWGSLDEQGILGTVRTLSALSRDVNVITVSHIGSVRDAFDSRVEVHPNGGTSEAVVVA